MNTARFIQFIPFSILVAACTTVVGNDDDDMAVFEWHEVEGDWFTGCVTDDDGDDVMVDATMTAEQFWVVAEGFSDAECRNSLGKSEINGTYVMGAVVEGLPSTREIDLFVSDVILTPTNSFVAQSFNTLNVAGYADWQVDRPKSVLGRSVNGVTLRRNDVIYEILSIEGNQLRWGDADEPPRQPEQRSRQLDNTVFLRR